MLLDSITLAIDEREEAKTAKREERTKFEKRTLRVGKYVRSRALSGVRQVSSETTSDDDPGSDNLGSSLRKQRSHKHYLPKDSGSEDRNLIGAHNQAHKDFE